MSQVGSDMDLEDRDFLLLSPLPRDNGFNFNYLPTQPTLVDYTRGVERENTCIISTGEKQDATVSPVERTSVPSKAVTFSTPVSGDSQTSHEHRLVRHTYGTDSFRADGAFGGSYELKYTLLTGASTQSLDRFRVNTREITQPVYPSTGDLEQNRVLTADHLGSQGPSLIPTLAVTYTTAPCSRDKVNEPLQISNPLIGVYDHNRTQVVDHTGSQGPVCTPISSVGNTQASYVRGDISAYNPSPYPPSGVPGQYGAYNTGHLGPQGLGSVPAPAEINIPSTYPRGEGHYGQVPLNTPSVMSGGHTTVGPPYPNYDLRGQGAQSLSNSYTMTGLPPSQQAGPNPTNVIPAFPVNRENVLHSHGEPYRSI